MQKSTKVTNELAADKAKRDASYEYGKKSLEPVGEGAFKGALASGVASRLMKTKSRGREAAVVAAGTSLGAFAGKKYNEMKVENANKARAWLADSHKEKKYIKDTKDIYKKSEILQPKEKIRALGNKINEAKTDPYTVVNTVADDNKIQKKGLGGIAKDVASGSALGAGFGAVFGKKLKALSALKGAALGGSGILASDIVENGESAAKVDNSRVGQIAGLGASFGASGAVEPLTNRLMGRYTKDKKYIRNEKDLRGGLFNKKNLNPKNWTSPKNWNLKNVKKSAPSDFLKGHATKGKGISTVFKGLGKPTLKAAGKFGLMGIGLGLGLDYLTNKNKGNQAQPPIKKTASVSLSSNDAIRAKTYDAKETLKGSLARDAALNLGAAGAGFGLARAALGKRVGGVATAMSLSYVLGKTLSDFEKRRDAHKYLESSYTGKISDLKKDVEDKAIHREDLYKAVVLNKAIEEFGRGRSTTPTYEEHKFKLGEI